MILRDIDSLTKADIENLISNQVTESKQLEYKRDLPDRIDSAKKEFLADVSSFANASGGDIIFGLEAELDDGSSVGYPTAVHPVASESIDDVKLWIEEVVRSGLEPRLAVQIREISGFGDDGNGCVILMRIPKSFASPHVVKLKGSFKFFSRHSAGKFQLDVDELRSHFLATDSQAERIRRFRQERLGKILAGETTVQLSSKMVAVLHLIPLGPFLNNDRLPLSEFEYAQHFMPLGGYGSKRFNLDGSLSFSDHPHQPDKHDGYCQLFFNGAVETVSSSLVQGRSDSDSDDFVGSLASVHYEQEIIDAVRRYLNGYKQLGINSPISVSFSMLNSMGVMMYVGQRHSFRRKPATLDRQVANFPDVVLPDADVEATEVLKPLFDSVWNAFGFPRSLNYGEDGKWNPRG